MIKIALDAGHGGENIGAKGNIQGLVEKDVVLSICKLLTSHNTPEETGYEIVMIRESDKEIPLRARANKANEMNANIFISIHANGAKAQSANGLETFHYPGSRKGAKLAYEIQKMMVEKTRRRNRGVKSAKFAVLRHTTMPAVLVEAGFLTNPEEEKLLSECEYQYLVADAILRGITSYYSLLNS